MLIILVVMNELTKIKMHNQDVYEEGIEHEFHYWMSGPVISTDEIVVRKFQGKPRSTRRLFVRCKIFVIF